MVVFVDLESSDDEPSSPLRSKLIIHHQSVLKHGLQQAESLNSSVKENRNSFAATLTCYPAALSLATNLDLNDLHSLSLTCRSIHNSLSQFARQLATNSLRCSLDSRLLAAEWLEAKHAASDDQAVTGPTSIPYNPLSPSLPHSSTIKWKPCARDLVAPCRKCSTVVCRNCSAKAPSDRCLTERHRRLCRTCLEAPLCHHLQALGEYEDHAVAESSPPVSGASSTRSGHFSAGSEYSTVHLHSENDDMPDREFTASAFLREPCNCTTHGSHLCWDCGHNLRASDTTYRRVWTWRSRYSTHIGGGIGTGLGLGNQGQKCGRGEHCLDTGAESTAWVEIDCSDGVSDDVGLDHDFLIPSRTGTPASDRASPSPNGNKPGYHSQEVEGIGGVVKKKVKKRVKVGATVYEWDDERRSGKYLGREARGEERSWCGWCGRVCLGEKDRQAQKRT